MLSELATNFPISLFKMVGAVVTGREETAGRNWDVSGIALTSSNGILNLDF